MQGQSAEITFSLHKLNETATLSLSFEREEEHEKNREKTERIFLIG